jgi:MFS family permease
VRRASLLVPSCSRSSLLSSPVSARLFSPISACSGSPLGGFVVDKFGRALNFICVACCMLIGAHVMFLSFGYGWVESYPVPVMLWLGVTYSLGASCLWPILAFVVEKDALGTAYGCMTSVQNLFLACFAVLLGQLQDWATEKHPGVLEYTVRGRSAHMHTAQSRTQPCLSMRDGVIDFHLTFSCSPLSFCSLQLPIMIFIGCAFIALCLTLLLLTIDARRGGKLNASAAERSARQMREAAADDDRNQAAFAADKAADKAALLDKKQQEQIQADSTLNGEY